MVIDLLLVAAGMFSATGFVGSGLLFISLGPRERGADRERSEEESEGVTAS